MSVSILLNVIKDNVPKETTACRAAGKAAAANVPQLKCWHSNVTVCLLNIPVAANAALERETQPH